MVFKELIADFVLSAEECFGMMAGYQFSNLFVQYSHHGNFSCETLESGATFSAKDPPIDHYMWDARHDKRYVKNHQDTTSK